MSLFPKGSAKPASDTAFTDGSLVLYENEQSALAGVILGFRKQKYLVLNERGREVELQALRLTALPGKMPANLQTTQERTQFLTQLHAKAAHLAGTRDLGELWSVVQQEERELRDTELYSLLFDSTDLHEFLGLRLALMNDRIYFKRDKAGFIPRAPHIIEELKRAEIVRQEQLALEALTVSFFKARMKNPDEPVPAGVEPLLRSLEDFAAGAQVLDAHHQKEAKDLISLFLAQTGVTLNGNNEDRAFQILLYTHCLTRNSNIPLLRHKPPIDFSAAELAAVDSVTVPQTISAFPEADRRIRQDLTSLDVFTIDDLSTKDMDDALSLEQTESGWKLGVHITDVASVIPYESMLDGVARKRATSIYCPDLTINMFPPKLAEETLSLVKGHPRPAMSVLFELDRHFNVADTSVVLSLVRVSERFSYEEVDELLEQGDERFTTLYGIAAHQESERLSHGAIKVNKNDATVLIDSTGKLTLYEIDEHSPARALIGEMMVLTNRTVAEFAKKQGFPIVYRGQEGPDPQRASSPASVPDGPARDYAYRSQLKKSTMSLFPESHSSLGLQAYTQMSSPIRRYLDLCNQRQIVSWLTTGKPALSEDQLNQILDEVEKPLGRANVVSRESKRFWLLRYLEDSLESSRELQGTVIRTDLKSPIVELDNVFITAPARCRSPVKPGDIVRLRVVGISPKDDQIRIEVID